MTEAQAAALLVVARKYHAGLLLRMHAGDAPEWIRTEVFRVGALLDAIDRPPKPEPPGLRNSRGCVD